MSAYVVWMDGKEGKIFDLVPDGPKVKHVRTHGVRQHLQPYGDHNLASHNGLDPFFKELAESLKDAKELILLGPADTKVRFRNYLEEHFAHSLAKSVVAVETVDHPTDNQILAHARKFFRSYDVFQR